MSKKELKIPIRFFGWKYDGSIYPGSKRKSRMLGNCQVFAYAFLSNFGFERLSFRSSELWDDTALTKKVKNPKLFDLVLINTVREPLAAHIGVYLGNKNMIHLSKNNQCVTVENIDRLLNLGRYKYLIGFKRLK